MKIDGYTAEEWVNSDTRLLIKDEDGNEIEFIEHYEYGEPAWPPLEANGKNWWIKERE